MARFLNHYACPCGAEWSDEWDCTCNDRCPDCNAECEPTESEDISEDDAQLSAPVYREEPTAAGIQLCIPGCERRPVENGKPAQLSLWG